MALYIIHILKASIRGFHLLRYYEKVGIHPKFTVQLHLCSLLFFIGGNDHIDKLLSDNSLSEILLELNSRPQDIPLSKDRFIEIFRVVEERTKEVQENVIDAGEWFRNTSSARTEMTSMYKTLQSLGYLQVFGAATVQPSSSSDTSISTLNLPAQGSKIITPVMLETITSLPLSALTPKPSNTLFIAGSVAALAEILFSIWTGIDFNVLVMFTIFVILLDRCFVSGANLETLLRWVYPDSTRKIIHHEAGHFLLAYLLGCPVEGIVLSTWAALKDARFGGGPSRSWFRSTVSAGTSFFDPELSTQMNRPKPSIRRTCIDRYSIIVMGGIAAEAMIYGHAEGGSGDETALISFLSNLYSSNNTDKARKDNSIDRTNDWTNIEMIKNQARFGVLQAVSIYIEYPTSTL